MQWDNFEKVFSKARTNKYLLNCNQDKDRAKSAYIYNLQLSEAFLIPLSILEISLRNSISKQLANKYNRQDWYEGILADKKLNFLHFEIDKAKKKLKTSNKIPDKVIAEFNFGFWTYLMNHRCQQELWQDISRAFPYASVGRNKIESKINTIREFRNRVFHYEPIIWMPKKTSDYFKTIEDIIYSIDPETSQWMSKISNVCTIIQNSNFGTK